MANRGTRVGGPAGRSQATFRIGAANYAEPPGLIADAADITTKLGLQPSEAHDAGEPRRSKSPRAAPYRHGVWLLKSPLPRATALETHVLWLIDRLLPVRSRLIAILDSDLRLEADIHCSVELTAWNQEFALTPKTLELVAALRASLWFDIYCMDDDDSTIEILPVDPESAAH